MVGSEIEVLGDGGNREGHNGVGDINVGRHRRYHLEPPYRLGRAQAPVIASFPLDAVLGYPLWESEVGKWWREAASDRISHPFTCRISMVDAPLHPSNARSPCALNIIVIQIFFLFSLLMSIKDKYISLLISI